MELHPGTIVAERYEVLGPLGRGGMGELYTARNLRTERRVALKLLRADAKFRADAIERFRREARAAGMISSEYVTQVFDVEDDPNWGIAIVFELLEGESLLERLRRTGPMTPAGLHPVITQILHGLVAAHAAGVIHRDLKPSNIYLERRPDGSSRVKILDFGISKLPKGMTKNTLTEPGQSLGSFMFMPPEQIHGAGRVDARADIYAVGTLAFQALTGHLPFDSTNIVELVRLKSSTNPRTLAEVLGRPTSPDLEGWLARALSRDVNARFQSAQEAAVAWANLAPKPSGAPLPSGAPPPMPAPEAQAPSSRFDHSGSPHSRPPPLPLRASSPAIAPQALPPAGPWGQTGPNPVAPATGAYPSAALGPAHGPSHPASPPPMGPGAPTPPMGASPAPYFSSAPPAAFPPATTPASFPPSGNAPAPFAAAPAPAFSNSAPPTGNLNPPPLPPGSGGVDLGAPPYHQNAFAPSAQTPIPGPGYVPPPYALAPGLAPPNAQPAAWQPAPYAAAPPLSADPLNPRPMGWVYMAIAFAIVVAVLIVMAFMFG